MFYSLFGTSKNATEDIGFSLLLVYDQVVVWVIDLLSYRGVVLLCVRLLHYIPSFNRLNRFHALIFNRLSQFSEGLTVTYDWI